MSKHPIVAATLVLTVLIAGLLASPVAVQADTCLMAYPTGACMYHYSTLDYYTVGFGHPLYDSHFDLGGEVLIKIDPADGDGVALDIYQAPGLAGLVADGVSQGYLALDVDHDLVIDGYYRAPTTYINILLVFDTFLPEECIPMITVNGQPVLHDPALGYYYPIGDLVVSTPAPHGNSYSDTVTLSIEYENCTGYRVWAFSDENYNLVHELPGECFTAYSHDVTIAVEETTWGAIKTLHK